MRLGALRASTLRRCIEELEALHDILSRQSLGLTTVSEPRTAATDSTPPMKSVAGSRTVAAVMPAVRKNAIPIAPVTTLSTTLPAGTARVLVPHTPRTD